MPDRTTLKHIAVFTLALAMLSVVPLSLMHIMTNVIDTTLIQSDVVRALLIISPMMSCVGGIALAMLYVLKNPELL